ncbi:MAG: hypothetical protein ACM3JJ_06635, partial [Hyphomicrobiales bacterium]
MSASKARESVWTLVGALVAVAVLATIAIAATCWVFLHPPPSDADLIARFRAHRADFDAVAAAATPDSDLVSVSRDPGWGRLRVMRLPSGAGGGHRIGERARGDEGDLYGRPLRRIGASG